MQLKGLGKRLHNIYLHTHTVSGIVISFGLFIIFFAGAFALFMDEGYRWENPTARYESPENLDIDKAFANVRSIFPNMDIDNDISIALPTYYNPELKIYAYALKPDSTRYRVSAVVNTQTYEAISFKEQKTHMIETLYHLHFFDQIPYIGLYLAGLVSLFFLFASITGLLVHWKHIVEKFYALRTKAGRKNFWKDAHTTLGLIGLPFQIIYSVTGAFFGLSILLLAPSVVLLFDGSQDEIRGILDPFFSIKHNPDAPITDDLISINEACEKVFKDHAGFESTFLRLRNYGTEEAAISVRLDDRATMTGVGTVVVDLFGGDIIAREAPYTKGYNAAYDVMIRLHYATYGGIWLKVVYFFLSMLTCFMIISGVLLWQHARDNKKYSPQQRRFHYLVTKVYLAICFSLFPAVAVLFIANMLVPMDMSDRIHLVDYIFFGSWLVLALCVWRRNSYRKITMDYLIVGGILSLVVPISNGLMTNDWVWKTVMDHQWPIAVVDLFWIVIGICSLLYARSLVDRSQIPARTL